MDEGIPAEIQGTLRDIIRAELLRIYADFIDGTDCRECLHRVYYTYRKHLRPLTDELLAESMPAWVCQWAQAHDWLPTALSDSLVYTRLNQIEVRKLLASTIARSQAALSEQRAATRLEATGPKRVEPPVVHDHAPLDVESLREQLSAPSRTGKRSRTNWAASRNWRGCARCIPAIYTPG